MHNCLERTPFARGASPHRAIISTVSSYSRAPLIRVQPLTRDQLSEAARVHAIAFPGFFLSSLGPAILREFYRAHLLSPTATALAATDEAGRLVGIATGTTSARTFYREMVLRNPARIVAAAAVALLRRPSAVRRVIAGLRHGAPTPWPTGNAALLSSICVDPDQRSEGIGAQLLEAWVQNMRSLHAQRAFLTTDAKGNDRVMGWYVSQGWSLLGTFTRADGRVMAAYTRDIYGCDLPQQP